MVEVSPNALYEKFEQVYRLLSAKISTRCIGSGQGRYLQLLLSRDGMSQSELVNALGVSPSSASELTDKLLAAGYITRKKDDADKRKMLVCITDSGKAAAADFQKDFAAAAEEAFGILAPDAKETLLSLLCVMLEQDEPASPVCDAMIRPGKRL